MTKGLATQDYELAMITTLRCMDQTTEDLQPAVDESKPLTSPLTGPDQIPSYISPSRTRVGRSFIT